MSDPSNSLHLLTLSELARGMDAGDFSSREVTAAMLGRLQQHESLNAMITVTAELALAAADQADRDRANGNAGALCGLPLVHKDLFCTAGVRTSCGSSMLDKFVSPYDATVVERMANAGAVMLGKTNMDEFAMGSSNETSFYGDVRNPWDESKSPGGSSGGSAAAVAGRLAPAAYLGSMP